MPRSERQTKQYPRYRMYVPYVLLHTASRRPYMNSSEAAQLVRVLPLFGKDVSRHARFSAQPSLFFAGRIPSRGWRARGRRALCLSWGLGADGGRHPLRDSARGTGREASHGIGKHFGVIEFINMHYLGVLQVQPPPIRASPLLSCPSVNEQIPGPSHILNSTTHSLTNVKVLASNKHSGYKGATSSAKSDFPFIVSKNLTYALPLAETGPSPSRFPLTCPTKLWVLPTPTPPPIML